MQADIAFSFYPMLKFDLTCSLSVSALPSRYLEFPCGPEYNAYMMVFVTHRFPQGPDLKEKGLTSGFIIIGRGGGIYRLGSENSHVDSMWPTKKKHPGGQTK